MRLDRVCRLPQAYTCVRFAIDHCMMCLDLYTVSHGDLSWHKIAHGESTFSPLLSTGRRTLWELRPGPQTQIEPSWENGEIIGGRQLKTVFDKGPVDHSLHGGEDELNKQGTFRKRQLKTSRLIDETRPVRPDRKLSRKTDTIQNELSEISRPAGFQPSNSIIKLVMRMRRVCWNAYCIFRSVVEIWRAGRDWFAQHIYNTWKIS